MFFFWFSFFFLYFLLIKFVSWEFNIQISCILITLIPIPLLSVLQNLNPPYKHHPCIHLVLLGLAVHPLSARWAYQCTWLKWLFLSVNLAVTKSTGKSPPQFVTNCEHDESLVEAQGKQSRLLWVRDGQGWVLPRKQQFTTLIPICLLLSAPPLHGLSLSHRSLSVVRVARSLGLHWCSLKQVFLIKSANNICPWVQIQIFRKQFDAVSVSLNNGNQFSRGSNGFSLHVVLSRLTISDTDFLLLNQLQIQSRVDGYT